MSYAPPPVEQATPHCPINVLADSDLEEIFKRLPPYERLLISEVCRRWNEISRKAWLDIKTLDLSPIPGKHFDAVIKQCPNLQFVCAVRKSFGSRELFYLTGAHGLSSVKFYACEFILSAMEPDTINDVFKAIFSDRLMHASWNELILHDASFKLSPGSAAKWAFSATLLPATLTRVQLSGLWCSKEMKCFYDGDDDDDNDHDGVLLEGLERLENLESFICHKAHKPASDLETFDVIHDALSLDYQEHNFYANLPSLANLKELCIGQAMLLPDMLSLSRLSAGLPKLEVLFFNDVLCDEGSDGVVGLNELITKNSVLRILVLAGQFDIYAGYGGIPLADDEAIVLPARKRFPNGFGSDPLPLLHIFIGGVASENIVFAKSASDAAIIHPINAPMPEFLKREDIAPIFDGVWVAERIKEAAENGARLWNYERHDDASLVQHSDD